MIGSKVRSAQARLTWEMGARSWEAAHSIFRDKSCIEGNFKWAWGIQFDGNALRLRQRGRQRNSGCWMNSFMGG